MLSKRPYLLKAFYDWIVDQGHVPHIVVDALVDTVRVPQAYVQDDRIQLNISPSAVRHFLMDRAAISFEARFGGQPQQIHVPIRAVVAIIDRDSGQGTVFETEPDEEFDDGLDERSPQDDRGKGFGPRPVEPVADSDADDADNSGSDDDEPPPDGPDGGGSSGKPRRGSPLRLVK